MRFAPPLLLLFLSLASAQTLPTPPGGVPLAAPSPLRDALERYEDDRRALRRFHSVEASEVRSARLDAFLAEWQAWLASFEYERLDTVGRVDWQLLRNHLERERRRLELDAVRRAEMAELLPFAETIVALEEARRLKADLDPEAAAVTLHAIAEAVRAAREALDERQGGEESEGEAADPWPPTVAKRAADATDELRRVLRGWHRYHDGYDPLYSWWCREPWEDADGALETYAEHLRENVAGLEDEDAILGDPIGREALLAELGFELLAYTPEELIALAEAELSWCRERLAEAAAEMGLEDGPAAIEAAKAMHVEPGAQPALVRDLAAEAVAFLKQHDLVSVPPLAEEVWRMEMMSPQRQRVTPFFTGGEVVSVSFPTDAMTHEEKLMSMRGNNVPFSRATVHHELIPGHHLQGFLADRHRTWRAPFRTAFLIEGWALYWELYLWDLGFPPTAADRVGFLVWRMHRCARVLLSLRFHLGEVEPPEMIDYLVEHVGFERDGAEGEVRRWVGGSYGPLYQCAYLVGGLQLRALHAELVGSGSMTDREFHDAVLEQGSIPIEAVRLALSDGEIPREWRPTWRFAGEPPFSR